MALLGVTRTSLPSFSESRPSASRSGDGEHSLGVQRDVAEQKIGLGGLNEVGPMQLARHMAGERQNGCVVAAGLIESGHQVVAAGTGGAGANRETAGQLCLASGGQRGAFLMTHADPFDAASTDRVRDRIQGVADQPEKMLDADLLEHANQDIRNRLRHFRLLLARIWWLSSPRCGVRGARAPSPSVTLLRSALRRYSTSSSFRPVPAR